MTNPTRRAILTGTAACFLAGTASAADDALAELEAQGGGRLGVAALDTGGGRTLLHRADERFAMCSTFKLALAGAIYARIDRDELSRGDRVAVLQTDLVPYAPVTERHVGGRMTIEALCTAAVRVSDNVAANLLLAQIGGPTGWTAFVRGAGDEISRLDRTETELNTNLPNDPRDTTTPAAMCDTMRALLLGDVLSPRSRARLVRHALGCETGDKRLRAGFPRDWRVGDKTGTSDNGAANDIGIAWPPGRPPILVAAYLDRAGGDGDSRAATLAAVARIVSAAFASPGA